MMRAFKTHGLFERKRSRHDRYAMTDTLIRSDVEDRVGGAGDVRAGTRHRGLAAAWHILTASGAMAIVGAWGIGTPVLWVDEIMTWSASDRSWFQIARVADDVDAVLAPYYLLMSVWTAIFGDSHLALRLPSLLAMIATAGLVAAIGARLHSPHAGAAGGLLLAALPAVSRYAQEARPYALMSCFAVLATLALLRAWQEPSRWRWIVYALACALTGWSNLLAFSVVGAHAVAVLVALWWRRAAVRGEAKAWAVSVAAAAVAVFPLLVLGLRQQGQISWLFLTSWQALPDILGRVAGGGLLAGLLFGLGVAAMVAGEQRIELIPRAAERAALGNRGFAFVAVAALAVLPFLLLFVTGMFRPLYHDRYVLLMLAAWAALAGVALARVSRPVAAIVLVAVVLLGAGQQLAMRQPDGHADTGVAEASRSISAQSREGDVIILQANHGWLRLAADYYLDPTSRPRDAMMEKTPVQKGGYLATECQSAQRCLASPPRVWVMCYGTQEDPLDCLSADAVAVLRGSYQLSLLEQHGAIRVGLFNRAN